MNKIDNVQYFCCACDHEHATNVAGAHEKPSPPLRRLGLSGDWEI